MKFRPGSRFEIQNSPAMVDIRRDTWPCTISSSCCDSHERKLGPLSRESNAFTLRLTGTEEIALASSGPISRGIGANCGGIVRRRKALLTKPLTVAKNCARLGGSSRWLPTRCSIGSRGRARTYNPSVNSRLLYH